MDACEEEEMMDTRSFRDIYCKICAITAVKSAFLISLEALNEAENLEEAKQKIESYVENIVKNNHKDFIVWIKRWLNL